ncbi:MAG TPA: hypothetical protein VMF89_17770, partial [Polyangiales bacterium]|nr:hypothetical protein [Polyangiales bacterium]
MHMPDARLTQSHRPFGLLTALMLFVGTGCDVYDASLVSVRMQPKSDAAVELDASSEAGPNDASDTDSSTSEPECTFM